jgi:hypothetical protein
MMFFKLLEWTKRLTNFLFNFLVFILFCVVLCCFVWQSLPLKPRKDSSGLLAAAIHLPQPSEGLGLLVCATMAGSLSILFRQMSEYNAITLNRLNCDRQIVSTIDLSKHLSALW